MARKVSLNSKSAVGGPIDLRTITAADVEAAVTAPTMANHFPAFPLNRQPSWAATMLEKMAAYYDKKDMMVINIKACRMLSGA